MRKLFLCAAVAAALAFTAPGQAKASWLSEYLHRRLDPPVVYPYYDPAYSNYYAPPDAVPYYYGYQAPYSSYYGPDYGYYSYYAPRYREFHAGRPWGWHDRDWHEHGWHEHGHGWGGHEGHEHHH